MILSPPCELFVLVVYDHGAGTVLDLTIDRVLAIDVPEDFDDEQATERYFTPRNAWIGADGDTRALEVHTRDTIAAATERRISVFEKRGKLGDASGCAPWVVVE